MSRLACDSDRRHARVVADDGTGADVEIDVAESPLGWLASRRDRDGTPLITPAELAAGERFRRDFTLAGLMGRTTMNWEAIGGRAERRGGAGGLVSDVALDAGERVRKAVAALGPDLAGTAIDVCCHLVGLGDVERRRGWPQRSGKVVLRLALSALARHYGLDEVAQGPARAPRRQWGAAGFKPGGAPLPPSS